MISADLSFLRAVAPRFTGEKARVQAAILDAVAPRYFATLRASEIDTPLRIAHFTAQVAHESAGFRAVEEFADGRAYEGRLDLGNTQPGDGTRYKGRGLIQLTGRANYRAIGRVLGLDLEARPALAAEPVNALSIACAYWNGRGLNRSADADDLNAVTRGINGGFNGLSDRRRYLVRAKAALAGASDDAADPLLRRGARGGAVEDLQRLLCGAGASLSVDGVFGAATHAAVLAFQRGRGLAADGIVGPKTWAALRS